MIMSKIDDSATVTLRMHWASRLSRTPNAANTCCCRIARLQEVQLSRFRYLLLLLLLSTTTATALSLHRSKRSVLLLFRILFRYQKVKQD